jgi:hypothetical protein
MRILFLALTILAMAFTGCSLFEKKADDGFSAVPTEGQTATNSLPRNQNLIVTAATSVAGKVMAVNEATPSTRFVVLGFPIGKIPPLNSIVGIYRQGTKIAEVKLTGPQSDENIVAEIVTGEPVVGDEARTQ